MLAIGRALMSRPRLLLLDEPSLGLAPLVVHTIFEAIDEISNAGTTILLVEQNAHAALGHSDRAYVLETGRIVMEGPSADLAADLAARAQTRREAVAGSAVERRAGAARDEKQRADEG